MYIQKIETLSDRHTIEGRINGNSVLIKSKFALVGCKRQPKIKQKIQCFRTFKICLKCWQLREITNFSDKIIK